MAGGPLTVGRPMVRALALRRCRRSAFLSLPESIFLMSLSLRRRNLRGGAGREEVCELELELEELRWEGALTC